MTENLYVLNPQEIVMYSVDWCPDCKRAKSFFERNQIAHLIVNVDNDANAAEFVKQVNDGKRSVPTIIFPDGSIMVEPSTQQLVEKFSKS